MLGVFGSIFPVILISALGYLVANRGLLSDGEINGLSRFVFSLALPFLLFDSLVNSIWPKSFDLNFLLAFYGVSYLIFGLSILVARKVLHLVPAEQAIFGLGSSYSNLVIVGLPIILAGLGEEALLPLLALVALQNLLLFPLVAIFAHPNEPGTSLIKRLWHPIKRVATNPLMIGLALGFLVKLSAIQMPSLLADPIHLLAQTGLPCSLIVLGASFQRYEIRKPSREALTMVGLKMVLQPLLVWAMAFAVFRLDPLWAMVAVMAAGMPTGVNAYVMAEQVSAGQRFTSTSIWISTLLAVITQAGLLAVFIAQGLT